MFSLIKNAERKNKKIVVFDFAAGSVGAICFEKSSGFPVKVRNSLRTPVNFLFDVNLQAALRSSMASFRQVGEKIRRPGEKIDETLCVFSSPWFVSQSRAVKISKEKPFEIKKNFFEELILQEEEKFFQNVDPKRKKTFIEHKAVKIALNGYFTKYPAGKKARTAEARLYLSLGVPEAMEAVEKEVLRLFGRAPRFASMPLVTFRVLDDIIKKEEGFLIIDIGGETTEIFFIEDNSPAGAVSFPVGSNFLLRKISSRLDTFIKEAPSVLRSYARGHRSLENAEKIAGCVNEFLEQWNQLLEKSLKEIAGDGLLPQQALLMGNEIISKYAAASIEKKDFSDLTVFGRPLTAGRIHQGWLNRFFQAEGYQYESSGKIEDVSSSSRHGDTVLLMEAFYANKYL